MKVNDTEKITELQPGSLMEYMRSGGPLPGKSIWKISANSSGSEVEYTNTYSHALAAPVQQALTHAMEHFLNDMRAAIEQG